MSHVPPSLFTSPTSPPELLDLVDHVRNAKLYLPSDFTTLERTEYGLSSLAATELRLRQAQALDLIFKLHDLLRQKSSNIIFKKTHARGQGVNTRAESLIQEISGEIKKLMSLYNDSREAMNRLGLPPDDETFRLLTTTDLRMKDPTRYHALGDGSKVESWIWTVGERRDANEWSIEGECEKYPDSSMWTDATPYS